MSVVVGKRQRADIQGDASIVDRQSEGAGAKELGAFGDCSDVRLVFR